METEIKVMVIGYKESNYQGETEEERFGPAKMTFIVKLKDEIDSYHSLSIYSIASRMAIIDGFSSLAAVITNRDPLFQDLRLDQHFDEHTQCHDMCDLIDC